MKDRVRARACGELRVGRGGRAFLITSNDQSAKPASPVLGSVHEEMSPSEKRTTKTPQRCASSRSEPEPPG
jgi:hypothetical protein